MFIKIVWTTYNLAIIMSHEENVAIDTNNIPNNKMINLWMMIECYDL